MTDSFDERLCNVFSLQEATPVLNCCVSSIQIDDDHPGFVLSWHLDSLTDFVVGANARNATDAPDWLQTPPPRITVNSFTDHLMHELHQVAGGRCGRVLLAPNSLDQFAGVTWTLSALQSDDFMQDAARVAFVNGERFIARTYSLTHTTAQRSVENNLPRTRRNDQPECRIFI